MGRMPNMYTFFIKGTKRGSVIFVFSRIFIFPFTTALCKSKVQNIGKYSHTLCYIKHTFLIVNKPSCNFHGPNCTFCNKWTKIMHLF